MRTESKPTKTKTLFQTVDTPYANLDRADHVWFQIADQNLNVVYKCCLCGMVTKIPPPYPTPKDWLSTTIELLTPIERAMCPYIPVAVKPGRD